MLEHTKRQDKWRILQHALSSYVYNRSLFAIFAKVEMAEEWECLRFIYTLLLKRNSEVKPENVKWFWIEEFRQSLE